MIHLPQNTALIIVDVQKSMDDPRLGKRNNQNAEANIAKLLEVWRAASRPIFHIQHSSRFKDSPFAPGSSGHPIKGVVAPRAAEPVIQKNVSSAFIGTDLEKQLRSRGIGSVVIVGLETDHCVSTTARMAGDLDFETYVVSDATATFNRVGSDGRHFDAEEVHAVSLSSLNGEFAKVVETADILRSELKP
ncbi:MAG: cysteine hydrolase family protein [Candidatus Bathyarchaeia archaeon]|jgi:nicotinamidase-related amidase